MEFFIFFIPSLDFDRGVFPAILEHSSEETDRELTACSHRGELVYSLHHSQIGNHENAELTLSCGAGPFPNSRRVDQSRLFALRLRLFVSHEGWVYA